MGAIDTAVGGIMGLMLGDYADERQYNQQNRLMGLQMRGQKEMTDYEMQKQWEMWQKTNYPAQIEMMKKAGLSPALIYGKGGAGATTTGNASGNVSGASAPVGGNEITSMIGLGMQKQLQDAQVENIRANTEKTKAEIPNVGKTGTNIDANTALTQVKTSIAQLEEEIKGRSKEDAITAIQHGALKVIDEARSALAKANVDEETWEAEIAIVKGELIAVGLRNLAIQAGITLTEEQTKAIGLNIAQGWTKLTIDQQNADTAEGRLKWDKLMKNVKESTKLAVEGVSDLLRGILRVPGKPRNKTTNTETMKDREGGSWENKREMWD